MLRRTLTTDEITALAEGTNVEGLTCEGDYGYGPCGRWLDWADGRCAAGHEIEIEIDMDEDDE